MAKRLRHSLAKRVRTETHPLPQRAMLVPTPQGEVFVEDRGDGFLRLYALKQYDPETRKQIQRLQDRMIMGGGPGQRGDAAIFSHTVDGMRVTAQVVCSHGYLAGAQEWFTQYLDDHYALLTDLPIQGNRYVFRPCTARDVEYWGRRCLTEDWLAT